MNVIVPFLKRIAHFQMDFHILKDNKEYKIAHAEFNNAPDYCGGSGSSTKVTADSG